MKKKQTKAQKANYQKYFPLVIFMSILFMSVGYAVINAVILQVGGEVLTTVPYGVFIGNATYVERTDALTNENATINTYYSTVLSSDITLEPNDETSQVTVQVTIYNTSDKIYYLNDISYDPSITGTYTNNSIQYSTDANEFYLKPNSNRTLNITFKYKDGADLTANTLSSIIKLSFIEYVTAGYNAPGIYEFIVPQTGTYKLEVWGASGGDTTLPSALDETKTYMAGGNGGYSSGEAILTKGEKIYVVVGGEGVGSTAKYQSLTGGYNGGGNVTGHTSWNHYHGSGGGATHIAKTSGLLQTLYSNQDQVLLVAGGGGGSRNQQNNTAAGARYGNGGAGGGITGEAATGYGGTGIAYNCPTCTANQTGTEEYFGKGGDATGNGAGGGGWYGGQSGDTGNNNKIYVGSGSGGSGYIGGLQSGLSIAGNTPTPTYLDGNSTIGNDGNGHAKLTLITSTEEATGVYIQRSTYTPRTDALSNEDATIISFNGTSLSSKITLEPNNNTSKVTITTKVYNPTIYNYKLNGLTLEETSNTNIKYSYTVSSKELKPNHEVTVSVTFEYTDSADLSQNTLTSSFIFDYEKSKIYPVDYVSMGYTTTIDITKFPEYPDIVAEDLVLELDYINLPDNNLGIATITKSYVPSTGMLTLKRTAVAGYGTVNFKGNLYAIPTSKLEVGSGSGSTTIQIDCTNIANYQDKTKNDFVYDVTEVNLGTEITGSTTFSKEYDPTTGILTITRVPVQETDNISFTVKLYTVEQ